MNAAVLEHISPSPTGVRPQPAANTAIYRVDMFDCPQEHAAAFKDRLAIIHGYFDTLEGCLYNRVATRMSPPAGESVEMVKIVTVVEWRDRPALDEAKTAVSAFYARTGFDPAAFMAERGIRGDFGVYMPIEP